MHNLAGVDHLFNQIMRKERHQGVKKEATGRQVVKPSIFQFPSLMQKTSGFMKAERVNGGYQIPVSITPDPQFKMTTFKSKVVQPQPTRVAAKIQRNSARIVRVPPVSHEPIFIKVNSNRGQNNLSQFIQPSEEQSAYQLSELETFDELLGQIQEKIVRRDTNVGKIAEELCQLEAIDVRGIQHLPSLVSLMIEQSLKQGVFTKQVQAVLLTLTEEVLTRDDLESNLLVDLIMYYSLAKFQNDQMFVQFIKRIGQQVYYIKSEKLMHLASLLSVLVMNLWKRAEQVDLEMLSIGMNLLLRNREIRMQLPQLLFTMQPGNNLQRAIFNQLRSFKLTLN